MFLPRSGRVQVTGGFWLLILWFWYANGWKILVPVLAAAASHELGHWAVLRLMGSHVDYLRVSMFGAEMRTVHGRLSYAGELAAALAGPAVNLAAGMILARMGPEAAVSAGAHLVLGLFNLLPIRPLDGGIAVYTLASWLAGPAVGERLTRGLGAAAALVLAALLGWLMYRSSGSLWLLPPFFGLVCAGGKEICGKECFL